MVSEFFKPTWKWIPFYFNMHFFCQAQNFLKLWGTECMVIGKLQGCECEPKKSVKSGGV